MGVELLAVKNSSSPARTNARICAVGPSWLPIAWLENHPDASPSLCLRARPTPAAKSGSSPH
eukprot:8167290-Alexandrium_andersonii.AAC.1